MELFNYLLKVSACSALFFAFYLLVLRKLTFFRINRFYLLFSVLLSFVIPALQITVEREVAARSAVEQPIAAQDVDLGGAAFKDPITVSTEPVVYEDIPFDWYGLSVYIYGAIVAALLLLTAWRIFQLLKHTASPVKEINGLKLVAKQSGFTNCSFFNYVFIDEQSLTQSELAVLLAHEEVHARQFHSVDKLLLMIAKAFLWFNPVIYLYDRALEQTHEYEADEATSENIGTDIYAALLLRLAVAKNSSLLTHNFVKSPIKQRIKMLFNSKSKNMKKLTYLFALPLALGLVWLLATEVVYAKSSENLELKQDKPFIERMKHKEDRKAYSYEKITINSPGKSIQTSVAVSGENEVRPAKLWFYINDKLYSEAEAQKFDAAFVKRLSTNKGFSFASRYDIPSLEKNGSNVVFWFGKEPKLSENTVKSKAITQKYNGTTVTGTVVGYSYSPLNKKLMDGFMLKTEEGVLLKVFVEAKFVKQANAMVTAGDKVTIKIYNALYWGDNSYPVLSSYKLMKNNKVLFDRWPKNAATFKITGPTSASVTFAKEKHRNYEFSAKDSTVFDRKRNVVHLYGNARLKNNKEELSADEIHYNLKMMQRAPKVLANAYGQKLN